MSPESVELERLAQETELALTVVEAEYTRLHGPDPSHWSKGVRGEYVEIVSSAARRRPRVREIVPQHPRRASAGTQRHHRKYVGYRVRLLVPDAHTVLLTPVWTDQDSNESGHLQISFMALVRDRNGAAVKLPTGASQRLAQLLQGAFPKADWGRCQSWRADTSQLTEYRPTGRINIEWRWA